MAIKVALLVIVAVGFSSYILLAETATEFSCNVNGVYSVVIGNVTFDLIGCMTNCKCTLSVLYDTQRWCVVSHYRQ